MRASDPQSLWSCLEAEGLVVGTSPPTGVSAAPWFVRVMLGIAGWIGGLFLMFFVGLALKDVLQSPAAYLTTGLVVCTAAAMLFRAQPDSDFASQLGLALSLAGQGLVLTALTKALPNNSSAVAIGMSFWEAILFVSVPNFVHRVWASWAGACAILFALADWHLQAYGPGLLAIACAWIWLNEFHYARWGATLRAGAYGLTLALIFAVAQQALIPGAGWWHGTANRPPGSDYHAWIGAGLGGIALLGLIRGLLTREALEPASGARWRILAAAGVLAAASLKAPGLAPAMAILLLGYANGNRLLAALGVAALGGYLFLYYYSLEATLLYKSTLLATTGMALLGARTLLHKWWPVSRQPGDSRA